MFKLIKSANLKLLLQKIGSIINVYNFVQKECRWLYDSIAC